MDVNMRHVIVVGGGRVGRRVASQLEKNRYTVTVVERDETKEETIRSRSGSRVVVGDGARDDVFERAEPERADVVAGLTNVTETNLTVCELAAEYAPEAQTMARIETDGEQEYAHLSYVDNIVYPAAAGASVATDRIAGTFDTDADVIGAH